MRDQKIQGIGARLLRVSTDRQDTDRQRADISRWEKKHGVSATHTFEDRESRLLAEKRADFQRLLRLVEAGGVNWVVIQTTDRLGFKHTFELFEFLSIFLRHGVQLYTAVDGKCLTSTDDFTVITNAISGQTSSKEIYEKSNRIQSKRILKGKAGQFASGMPPYGFDVICKDARGGVKWRFVQTGRRQGRWLVGDTESQVTALPSHNREARETLWLAPSIVAERVETLKRVFQIFDSESISTLQIARRLNEEGISPVLQAKWDHSKLWLLLQNPAVIGRPASNKVTSAKVLTVEGEDLVERGAKDIGKYIRLAKENWLMPDEPIFEPLVHEDIFWRCCMKLNASRGKRAPKNENLILSGLLYCGTCGLRMAGQRKPKTSNGKRVPGTYNFYRCQTYMVHKDGAGNTTGCRNHGTLQETIMPFVEEFLKSRGQVLQDLTSSYRDRQSLTRLLAEHRATDSQVAKIIDQMRDYLLDQAGGVMGVPEGDVKGLPFLVDMYDQVFDGQKKELETELKALVAEHGQVANQYFKLPPKAQEIAVKTLEDLESRIASVQASLGPLTHKWEDLVEKLSGLRERIGAARVALETGSLRHQAQTLRNVIDRIEVHYVPKGARNSSLVKVIIVPLVGEAQEYQVEGITVAWH